jgi:hypothetical protein
MERMARERFRSDEMYKSEHSAAEIFRGAIGTHQVPVDPMSP